MNWFEIDRAGLANLALLVSKDPLISLYGV